MKQSKVELFGTPLLWAAGLGAIISKGFGVPFLDVAGLIYVALVITSRMSWKSGHEASRNKADRMFQEWRREKPENLDDLLTWRGDDTEK